MKDLVEAFDHLAVRGTPRGADAVFDAASGYVMLAPDTPRIATTRRLSKVVLAAAASIALVATGAIIANRVSDDSNAGELNDVNPEEALPLARAAVITADKVGSRWRLQIPLPESVYEETALAIRTARPECAVLASVGLLSPTTKSVAARQAFTIGNPGDVRQTVFVFATTEDASRAMDDSVGFSRRRPRRGPHHPSHLTATERSSSVSWRASRQQRFHSMRTSSTPTFKLAERSPGSPPPTTPTSSSPRTRSTR